eukprot:Hpha_TRINITY_DN12697_c0_g3::TRINITY_DN12697_c0_g3_i1::g.49794::m.49794/K15276/SLC35B2, PAPST1; solute carrier family 35 (adenosine 3'-phospho 5'-phosphosulfate transporter), member B2
MQRRVKSVDKPKAGGEADAAVDKGKKPRGGEVGSFLYCFVGLQVAYLAWGVAQEKVMTTEYEGGRLPSGLICVFFNRLLAANIAFFLAGWSLPEGCARTSFGWCALSNVCSSYAQYEALRYTSFPLQVLSKSTKVLPVMAMRKAMGGKPYSWAECIEALIICSGVVSFALFDPKVAEKAGETSLAGVGLLAMYIVSDAFTSPWQQRLFEKNPGLGEYQAMLWTNVWSILQVVGTLVVQGKVGLVVYFMVDNPAAWWHVGLSAVAGAVGQLFIHHTIKKHGAVAFVAIMTTRQVFAMALSSIMFDHPITTHMQVSAVIVFAAVAHSIWRKVK